MTTILKQIPPLGLEIKLDMRAVAVVASIWCVSSGIIPARADAQDGRLLYIQSNHIAEGENSILGYRRMNDGSLSPLDGNPFFAAGTGMNNNTYGKVGPHDNDTPIALARDGNLLYCVNVHSNTIAAFHVKPDGQLLPVAGMPFSSYGIGPNSISVAGDTLLVSNRNEDYHQPEALRGRANASYVSFKIERDGSLNFVSKIEVDGFHKPTQVLIARADPSAAFGNDFQVDADFDLDGTRSFLAGPEPRVQGQLHAFKISSAGKLTEVQRVTMPETDPGHLYKGTPDVPSLPLGIWDHPTRKILYVGLITRNELGVFRYDSNAQLEFVTSVPNSGQDICWILVNRDGTRLYSVNNLPRDEMKDKSATISIYDIAGDKAEKPAEIGRVLLPHPGKWFTNDRNFEQPGSTPFQLTLSPDGHYLYVMSQRINQIGTDNRDPAGNYLHVFAVDANGLLTHTRSRALEHDGIDFHSRPQGVVALDR